MVKDARSEPDSPDDADVTLRDLLAIEAFGLRLLTGADQLDRPIRWAHSTELLDPRPYLRGHELVLTVGAALTGPGSCQRFVANVAEAGASAIGFGVGDVVETVPPMLVAACSDAGLALVSVPPGMPFLSITEMLAERRAEARAAQPRRLQRLIGHLLDVMGPEEPLEELLAYAAQEIGGTLEVRDRTRSEPDPTNGPDLSLAGAARLAVPLPIPGDWELVWSAHAPSDLPPTADDLAHIARVLALRQHGEDVDRTRQRAELGRLVHLVLTDLASPMVLEADLLPLGLDLRRLVVTAWPATAAPLVASRLGPALLAQFEDVLFTLNCDARACLELAREAALPCGAGTPRPVSDLRIGLAEAVAALALSRRRGTPARAEDLTTLEGLLEQQPRERLAPFARQLIAPLAEHDARHGGQLVTTLRAVLEHDGVQAAARSLYLHPNSLRHRLGRIAELTGRNPLAWGDRVSLAIGLWAWDKRPTGGRG